MDTYNNLTTNINPYDFLGKCYQPTSRIEFYPAKFRAFLNDGKDVKPIKDHFTALEYTPFAKKRLGEIPPCVYGAPLVSYLNTDSVKKSLHIPDDVQAWDLCSDTLVYDGDVNETIGLYGDLKSKYRILKYSGDTDGVLPAQGTKNWIDSLNWNITSEWK
jgi:hypothetical protein